MVIKTVLFKALEDLRICIKYNCISLDPNSLTVFLSLEEYSLLPTSMGHLVSKHKQMDLKNLPQVCFSVTEEVPQ